MSDYQTWSYVLAIIGVSGLYLVTKKLYAGFVVGLLVQLLWVAYAVVSNQPGFILSAAAFAWVNFLGIRRWTRNEKTPAGDISTTKVSQEAYIFRPHKEES